MLAALTGDETRFQLLVTKTEALANAHALGVFDTQVRDSLHWARGLRELTAGNPESAVTWFSAMSQSQAGPGTPPICTALRGI